MITGEQIKAKRKELGISAPQLGKRLGIDPENIYKWEKGTKPSDPDDYKKIENFVNSDVKKLEDIPNLLEDPETNYGDVNVLREKIKSLRKLLLDQEEILMSQKETIKGHEETIKSQREMIQYLISEKKQDVPDRKKTSG